MVLMIYDMRYLSRSVLVVYGSAFAGTLLVAVEVPSSVTSLGAVESLLYYCMSLLLLKSFVRCYLPYNMIMPS